MTDHSPAPETQNCGDSPPEKTIPPATTTVLSEAEACYILFVVLSIAGLVALVVYEVVTATGSAADTTHSILLNLWRPSAFALTVTLTAAAITRGTKLIPR